MRSVKRLRRTSWLIPVPGGRISRSLRRMDPILEAASASGCCADTRKLADGGQIRMSLDSWHVSRSRDARVVPEAPAHDTCRFACRRRWISRVARVTSALIQLAAEGKQSGQGQRHKTNLVEYALTGLSRITRAEPLCPMLRGSAPHHPLHRAGTGPA